LSELIVAMKVGRVPRFDRSHGASHANGGKYPDATGGIPAKAGVRVTMDARVVLAPAKERSRI
jgi:hypothetical protein